MIKRFLALLCAPIAFTVAPKAVYASENTQIYPLPQKFLDDQAKILYLLQLSLNEFYALRTLIESMCENTNDLHDKVGKILEYEDEDHKETSMEEWQEQFPKPKKGTPNWLPKSIQGNKDENTND